MKDRQADKVINAVSLGRSGDDPFIGTEVRVGDVSIPEIFDVTFEHPAGKPSTITVKCWSHKGFNVTLPMEVNLSVTVLPDHELIVKDLGNGQVSYASRAAEVVK